MLLMNKQPGIKGSKNNKKSVRTTLYIPKDLHSKLKIEAIKRETSMTQLVIEAVQKELEAISI